MAKAVRQRKHPAGKIGFIGLGAMGLGMAKSLLAEGFDVRGYDVMPKAVRHFVAAGGRSAKSPHEAAEGASIVICVVINAAQTEAVLFGEDGCIGAMPDGSVFVGCATMPPDVVRTIAARVVAAKKLYLDAPLSGGAQRAAEGALTILASGPPKAFLIARGALNAMAAKLYELGDEPGVAASFKMVNQLLAGAHIAAACEAITFAAKLGLDLNRVHEVITEAAGNSWMFENRIPHVLKGDYTPLSAVNIFTKDLGIVLDMGRRMNFPTPVASNALQLFTMTSAMGMGRDDDSSVARLYAAIAGLELPKGERTTGPRS
jgi:3-hydroxyisobutyrate dehydrogenase